ncbi:MAG: rRNA (cytosine967-C5)-methyltransferase [Aliidongia sp.]|jgi:16S rRNA (cytosine967-C5)-methyltransferase|nr:rRNA (cytosine967-C5)-methyltransferase [Aliidongia sp.]
MTPGARVQAAIELIGEIETGRAAADDIVGGYFRRHRFAGSKDRAAISEHIYAVLRRRAAIDWYIARIVPGLPPSPRKRVLAALALVEGWRPDVIDRACDGDVFRPTPLDRIERGLIEGLAGKMLDHPEMPQPVRCNYPLWLDSALNSLFGDRLTEEMAAMNGAAPLDLRVNQLKSNRADARKALAEEGIDAVPTEFAPTGLRVYERIPLSTLEVFKSGRIEVQDEGSQLAALLAEAKPGMRVVDFCAGAGGKTLAIAAQMRNKGHLIACDISAKRLERSATRLRRAGISNVERRQLSTERDKWVKHHAQSFDRVFVDAPCTGTGTWRRNPDAKWRLEPKDLTELVALQARILESAARLAKPGGRVIYATCSLLPEENDRQIEAFLAGHPDFALVPIGEVWRDVFGKPCPEPGDMLHLTPARHGTDGFFVAVLMRNAATPETPSAEPDDEPDSLP